MQEECTQAVSVEEGRSQLRKTESALERKRKQEKKKKKTTSFSKLFANIAFSPIPHFPTSCNQHSILSLSTQFHGG